MLKNIDLTNLFGFWFFDVQLVFYYFFRKSRLYFLPELPRAKPKLCKYFFCQVVFEKPKTEVSANL